MTLIELLPFALVALAFWLLILRPASTRRKEQAALLARLAPGQRVMTTAGVFGTLTAVDSETVHLEVAPGVVIELVPQAIGRVVAEAATQGPGEASPDPLADAQPHPGAAADLSPEADRG
jgi:preprotein translocase subunit YajC